MFWYLKYNEIGEFMVNLLSLHISIFSYCLCKLWQLDFKKGKLANLMLLFDNTKKLWIGLNVDSVFEKVWWFEIKILKYLNCSIIWFGLIENMLNWNWSSVQVNESVFWFAYLNWCCKHLWLLWAIFYSVPGVPGFEPSNLG